MINVVVYHDNFLIIFVINHGEIEAGEKFLILNRVYDNNLFRNGNFGDEYLYVGMIIPMYSYCASAHLHQLF